MTYWGLLIGCLLAASATGVPASATPYAEKGTTMKVNMKVKQQVYRIELSDTPAARAFAQTLPVTLKMDDLNRNEKFAELAQALPTREARAGTIHAGDIMLYGTQTLVVFYQTFASDYRYTPLGKIVAPDGLEAGLGERTAEVTFY
ncbi:cyclophilin-like fold protein [Erwinia persicina]|uniref:cyclophilin-like fold protein n=1 Tax=Erwinia persicina TaxID=55211 RepID=UPI001FCE5EA9|nr:cyclophilin-like fold protein [Erwinia persicina]